MKRLKRGILTMVLLLSSFTNSFQLHAGELPLLETVAYVDLNRYLGRWYEIASFPQNFSRGCVATTATYSKRADGRISVRNACRLNRLDGKHKSAKGIAKVVDTKTNAKLEVTFFWPFSGKYWIIDLGEDYEFAVVGHPNRDYLWILSRSPRLDPEKLDGILARIEQKGFDLDRLQMTLQP